jgi:hypothetical protein
MARTGLSYPSKQRLRRRAAGGGARDSEIDPAQHATDDPPHHAGKREDTPHELRDPVERQALAVAPARVYMNSAAFPAAHASNPIILPGMSRPVAIPKATFTQK